MIVPCFLCGLQRRRERRGGGLDSRAQFRQHGKDAPEHGGGEDDGEEGCLAHDICIPFDRGISCFKKCFHELDAGRCGFLSMEWKRTAKTNMTGGKDA